MAKSLVEVLQENNLELKESSSNRWVTICPFHEGDRDPSFTVYPTNTYYCWGCEAWGDVVKFLVEYKGWTSKQALEYVGEDYVLQKVDKSQVIKIKNVSMMWKFLYEQVTTYHKFILQTPGALNYLYRRGLTDATIERYKIGYTDGNVLNLRYAEERQLALEAGLVNRAGYEVLGHRIIIPNLINTGKGVDFVIGRTVVNDPVKYLGLRVPKPLFGFYEIRHSPILFVVEGQFDWLLLRQWGYPAINMSGHHLPKYLRALLSNKFLVIVPDYDGNNVGQNAAKGLHESFGDRSMILDYSRYKEDGINLDIGEFGLQDDAEAKFAEVVKENIWSIPSSMETLARWLPSLVNITHSVLT